MKLKKGDRVLVTAGKDKGREGKIARVFPGDQKILVEGINVYKRHLKPRGQGQQQGQIIERERPLLFSNVALMCMKCTQPTRVGYQFDREGKKRRICRKCNSQLDK